MSDFAKMDIFFVITSVVVVALGVLLALVLYRVLRILFYAESIAKELSEEAKLMRGDIATVRTQFHASTGQFLGTIGAFLSALQRFFMRKVNNTKNENK